jgi:hypothetical protein
MAGQYNPQQGISRRSKLQLRRIGGAQTYGAGIFSMPLLKIIVLLQKS